MMKKTKEIKAINQLKTLLSNTEWVDHVFLVGGVVRDQVMGKTPKDIDLVVDIPNGGVLLCDWFCEKYPEICINKVIYPNFGTAKFSLLVNNEKVDIEMVQTRSEQYHDKESRDPMCSFGTLNEDCFRRDLTINSLYRNIITDEILDLTGMGLQDIKDHIIRTPMDSDVIFMDDPLRMLRCVRFASRYGWGIDPNLILSIVKNKNRLSIISNERIMCELNQMLICDYPTQALTLLVVTGLLNEFIPEFTVLYEMEQNKYHFGSVWLHTLHVVGNTQPILKNRLAALFHDIGKSVTQTKDENGNIHFYDHEYKGVGITRMILTRLKYPTDIIDDVCFAVQHHMWTKSFGKDKLLVKDKSIRKLQAKFGDKIDFVFDVIHADNISHAVEHNMPNQINLIREKIIELSESGASCSQVRLPINGKDIMEIKNIGPSPKIKQYLDVVTDHYFENPKITYEECVEILNGVEF